MKANGVNVRHVGAHGSGLAIGPSLVLLWNSWFPDFLIPPEVQGYAAVMFASLVHLAVRKMGG